MYSWLYSYVAKNRVCRAILLSSAIDIRAIARIAENRDHRAGLVNPPKLDLYPSC